MMQSPVSDIPPASASPRSSTPNSPNNNNNQTTKNGHTNDTQFPKFEPIRLERPQATKFDCILLPHFHGTSTDDSERKHNNRPLIYPKDMDLENGAKFSIERLKQLTNHNSLNRLSPSEDSNHSTVGGGGGGGNKYSQETLSGAVACKSSSNNHHLSPKKCVDTVDTTNAIVSNPHQNNPLSFHHPFPIKYPMSTTPTILPHGVTDVMDIERFKLARSMTNGRDLTDFGFRIQLGAFQTNYAHSDTSEELVVDENNELSSSATPLSDNPTVSFILHFTCTRENLLNFQIQFHYISIMCQVCPVDLTRTIPVETNKETTRKLAFSVENILDPNKFCSKKDKFNARHWIENYERGERERLDDDQSESQSGKFCFEKSVLQIVLPAIGIDRVTIYFKNEVHKIHFQNSPWLE